MNRRIQLPVASFSRDLTAVSRVAAAIAGVLAAAALIASAVLIFESQSLEARRERMLAQTAAFATEAAALRDQQTGGEPDTAAIAALRRRIASLNALDFAQAPSVTGVLGILENLMPDAVALQNLDYDRTRGALDLVALSASSEDLTAFFDAATKNLAFKTVRLIDKKQAGAAEDGIAQYQVRLSIILAAGEPRT
jgi:hypothetical protein